MLSLFLHFFMGFLTPKAGHAAPFPGTSSSALVSHQPGLYFSDKGFQMHAAKTDWVQILPPKNIPSLVTVYRAPLTRSGEQAALTVRVDDLRKPLPLKTYVKKWMRDYSRFGFEILTAKPVKVGDNSGFLLDLSSHETQKQLRQIVFVRDLTAVILTCRDGKASFAKTVEDCNEIFKTFSWIN